MHDHIIQGNREEVSRIHAAELAGHKVEIRFLDTKRGSTKVSSMIREGMFPELLQVTEADFKAAEWQGPKEVDF
jgi:hypothetical protein